MNLPPLKYRLADRLEALQDPQRAEYIKALICWRLRIWHTTLHRKMFASYQDVGKDRTFSVSELLTVYQVFNEIAPDKPLRHLHDLLGPVSSDT